MATTTPNLGLHLTPQNGGNKNFQTFRTELAGDGSTSNMMLIDAAVGALQNGKYEKPSGGIPDSDLSETVRAALALAISALQTAPVTSVNGQTGAVIIAIPDVSGKLDVNQGIANAGKVMAVDSSGNIVPITPSSSGDPVQITIGDVDGLQAALNEKEPFITAGTTAQYLRGDKTWQALNKNAVGLGDVENVSVNDQTPTYSEASTKTDLQSGETLSVALGKIKKWFSSLGALAFKSSVSKTDLDSSALAEYRTSAAQDLIDAGKQATLTAGANITIVDNVISASGGGGSETSVLSQTGDIIIRNSTGAVRLGIGTAGQVLTVVNGLPAWQSLPTYDGDVEYLTEYDGGVD